jgi:hypothetical protein
VYQFLILVLTFGEFRLNIGFITLNVVAVRLVLFGFLNVLN